MVLGVIESEDLANVGAKDQLGNSGAKVMLSARDVVVSYGGVAAVDGVSFDVKAGEALGLIGPNGAGKSSMLAALGGQAKAGSGSIVLDGHEIARMPAYRRARLGLVRTFQATSEFADMTTFENLVTAGNGYEGARLTSVVFRHRLSVKSDNEIAVKAWAMLERFDMADKANAYGRELSGGQRRLVEIMRCLMSSPKVLLLDEPMVGVAPHLVEKLLGDLKSIRDEGIAIVIVEHALEVVRALSNRVVVMSFGKKIADAPYDEIVHNREVQDAYLG